MGEASGWYKVERRTGARSAPLALPLGEPRALGGGLGACLKYPEMGVEKATADAVAFLLWDITLMGKYAYLIQERFRSTRTVAVAASTITSRSMGIRLLSPVPGMLGSVGSVEGSEG